MHYPTRRLIRRIGRLYAQAHNGEKSISVTCRWSIRLSPSRPNRGPGHAAAAELRRGNLSDRNRRSWTHIISTCRAEWKLGCCRYAFFGKDNLEPSYPMTYSFALTLKKIKERPLLRGHAA